MTSRKHPEFVLAIYFSSRGFAFALVRNGRDPLAWGTPKFLGKDTQARCLKRIEALLAVHTPDVLVLQDMSKGGVRRTPRVEQLNRETMTLAREQGIPVRTQSRAQVSKYFQKIGADTKQRIAEVIVKDIPALDLYLPPPRKPWKSEDTRMGIFAAVALIWTYLDSISAI